MNDELFQAEYRTRLTRSMSDEDMAREMFDAGKRVERERIIQELDRISDTSHGFEIHSMRVETFIDELRAEPYTEGA